ncbi:polyamine oxidase (exo-N4-amino) 1 [Denticeps clupeoides]|uniref:polyamine oxidase (exo-N4-amino) 1 n=1 Tax=Denticeps clupeoides TaxID=299321 RepID=UPI0010A32FFD|nr:peroxisomal N(1)-acetyl-spermine/spermidine oxidase-like [Denticeps clupeoides]XP_028856583.1 peroxisomal N(1)-acetyl-spermine/spermidine oxidase-like [Denticeps clupeoides]
MEERPRVVVLGAGLAGIAAATRLREAGFQRVFVVEAAEEAGGRVARAGVGKSWVDTGAQFIHGASDANPVYSLLKQHNLLSELVTEEGSELFLNDKGSKVDTEFANRMYEAGEEIIWRKHEGLIGKSLGEHFAEESQQLIQKWGSPEEEQHKILSILHLVGKNVAADVGVSDLRAVSLNSWQYFCNMGDDLNVEGKMFMLKDKLLEDLPKDRLLLNRPVSKVYWEGSFRNEEGHQFPVCLLCENGEQILADHVVVTVSVGYLKTAASTFFDPPLPQEKLEAVEKLGFGCLNKIFLEYEEAFWESDISSISLVWEGETPADLSSSTTRWIKSLQHFTVMRPKETFGNVLIGWCSGNVAEHVETLTEQELACVITENFRKFTGNPSIPVPKRVLRTQWQSKKFIQGTYTYIPPGIDAKIMDKLAEPLSSSKKPSVDLQVLFAGEGTIKELYGTVQGALLSGHREAERLAQHYGRAVSTTAACSLPDQEN